ncbi:MAG: hypothetical protein NVSMB64_17280 [Candidatus Velthaea sp.]
MGASANAFYSSDATRETLFRRVRPSEEQATFLQEKHSEVEGHLKKAFRGYNPSTWLQGSYKYGTLVRPARSSDEYDVDLGFYVSPEPPLNRTSQQAVNYRQWVRDSLTAFVEGNGDAKELAPVKERCERIVFRKQFHVDVPCYVLTVPNDERTLATRTKGWEASDPKRLYLWFRNFDRPEYRASIRRVICYLKTWANLSYLGDDGKPSSIVLTVVAAEAFRNLSQHDRELEEDERFALLIDRIHERFTQSKRVPNPVAQDEDLNRLDETQFAEFLRQLTSLQETCRTAIRTEHQYYSALYWSEAFLHFFPLPESSTVLSLKESNAAPATIVPEVSVEVRSVRTGASITSFRNSVPMVDKGCVLLFSISNANSVPADAIVEWTVRNVGSEASDVNDLGHRTSGMRLMSSRETTSYAGRQFMDCVVKRGTSIIAARRVDVTISNKRTTR